MNSERNRKNFSALLLIVTFFSFTSIFLRFSQIMVQGEINGEDLAKNVEALYTKNNTLQAKRGTIYDRFGNPIALDAKAYKMIGILTDKWSSEDNPQHVLDKAGVAEVLSRHINLEQEDILHYLNKDVDQVEFGAPGDNLSYHTVQNIQKDLETNDLKGIIFEERQKRLYPNGTFASHTVGFAQYTTADDEESEKELMGVSGLENTFDELLTGINGQKMYQKDRFGYLLPGLENEETEPKDGHDLYMTLDHKLQAHLEIILDKVQSENESKAITVNVLDVKTGEILANGQRPSYNATTLEDIETWQNLLVEYTFEPGSTMKVLTLAAAIEEGVFNPNNYYESGSQKIHGGYVRDHNPNGWGWISELEGISRSSNTLFVNLVEQMGHDVWKEYLDAFGLGKQTGIALPNEQAGVNPYEWPLQKVNTGFGQGISVTPIQMLQAFNTIANQGEMIKPKLIKKSVESDTGIETDYETVKLESPISKETAEKTLAYLKEATEMEFAVARHFTKEGQSLVAKTGTAQLVDASTGLYSASEYIYSVVSMFPAENPEYLVYITVQEPNLSADAPTGNQVVVKIFHALVDRIIDFTKDAENTVTDGENLQYISTPSLLDQTVDEAVASLNELTNEYTVIGTGDTVVQQLPYPDTPLFNDQQIILMTNGATTMPDLTNWSRNDALKVAELTGTRMNFLGEGYVLEQDLAVGSYMEPGTTITITLSSEKPGDNLEEADNHE